MAHQQKEQKMEKLDGGNMPEWLGPLLKKTFFGPCSVHNVLEKNEVNRYCIVCHEAACRHCESSDLHNGHKLLKVHHHVHKDVVPLKQMQALADCSNIQTYRCNKELVISLHPLPHRGSGEFLPADASCRICKRKLHEAQLFRFCSIACKVSGGPSPPADVGESSKKRKHSRKGVPKRAPFS